MNAFETEPTFKLRGKRDYLSGTTVFDWFRAQVGDAREIDFQFNKFTSKQCRVVEKPEKGDEVVASFRCVDANLFLIETDTPITGRYECNEALIVEKAHIDGLNAEFGFPPIESSTFLECLVAIYKEMLLRTEDGQRGKLIFARVKLDHVPDSGHIQLKHRRKIGDRFLNRPSSAMAQPWERCILANIKIGIDAVGTYVPNEKLDTIELGKAVDATEEFIRTKLGFMQLAKKGDNESTSDLCVRAYEDLVSKWDSSEREVGCAMVVTQNPDSGGIPHTSAIVHRKLGLPKRVACCDISLGCTGFVHACSVMIGFMRENNIQNGLLFTADPYSTVIDPQDRDTVLLFGDGATCSLISTDPKYVMGRSRFVTDSKFCNAIKTADDSSRTLSMSGSDVFRFVAKNLPREIRECLAENELDLEQIDTFLIHQGSKFIVETLATALKVSEDRMRFEAGLTGNTVSSSIPLILADVLNENKLPQLILAAGFGVGLSSFVSVLKRAR